MRRSVTTAVGGFGVTEGFGGGTFARVGGGRGGPAERLRLALVPAPAGGGPDKFARLDLKRRRAQIRARRELGLS